MQIEVDRVREKALDPFPGIFPDRLQRRPLLPDNDSFLRFSLDDDVRLDVDFPPLFAKVLDLNRDGVGYLLA